MQHARQLPSGGSERPVSYEKYLVDTALDLNREVARHFETLGNTLEGKEAKQMAQNSRRAYGAIDELRRIEVGA